MNSVLVYLLFPSKQLSARPPSHHGFPPTSPLPQCNCSAPAGRQSANAMPRRCLCAIQVVRIRLHSSQDIGLLESRRALRRPEVRALLHILSFAGTPQLTPTLSLHTHSISPSLPPSSVLTRILAAPINPADVNTIQGTYGEKPTYRSTLGTADPSAIPGNEGCLEVLAVGPGVTTLQKGDWCIPSHTGFGTWRTHALVENADRALLKVDKTGLTPTQIATVSVNPSSAYRMLRDYVDLIAASIAAFQQSPPPEGGAWFVQNGANSGVGRAAIQLGKLWGLRSINVIRAREGGDDGGAAATEALKQELRDLGATVVVTEAEFADREFRTRVKEEFTRMGRDSVMLGLNCVGGKSATNMAKMLGKSGTLVTYGAMSKQPVMLPTGLLIFNDLRFRGFWLSRWANADPEGKKKTVDEILGLVREGKFRDAPMQELKWDWDTEIDTLRGTVQGTLGGFRAGKSVFVFGDT